MALTMIWYLTHGNERTGATWIVPGSHRRGRLPTRPWKDAPKNTISESIPVPLDWLDEPVKHVEMGVGAVVLLHHHLCHNLCLFECNKLN